MNHMVPYHLTVVGITISSTFVDGVANGKEVKVHTDEMAATTGYPVTKRGKFDFSCRKCRTDQLNQEGV